MKKPYLKNGFTMIELLLVIALLGILSGVLVNILNPTVQKERARDGVKISNLQNVASAIEAYYGGEGSYPASSSGVPATSPLLSTYLKAWPSADYTYYTVTENNIDFFCIDVPSFTTGRYFKFVSSYHSTFTGGSSKCGGVVLDCPDTRRCAAGTSGNDIGNCKLVSTGASCNP